MSSIDAPDEPALSIVIPAYNEAVRLGPTLERISEHLGPRRAAVEVLVVDDGSADATSAVARAEGERLALRVRALRHQPNRGKGFAVREGMLAARGRAVLFMDADLSVSIEHLDAFLARLEAGADAVFGSRRVAGAEIALHQPRWRERSGDVFRRLARAFVVRGVSDFTCGFKLFRREAARAVFQRQRMWGWGFDVEIALIARRLGLVMVEEPVAWRDDRRTRVRLLRDALRSALDLVRVRLNDARGLYGPPRPAPARAEAERA